ncbi:MAG: Amuc_1100 family pilus-like protein [Verrucomicrobiota bacterium]|nr:Amuc_1100 family pilus-like protein [Verrucomicrobiota bacterium]MCC6819675.1 hypothetical protein [Limisphaerales bacterium]
MDWIKRNLIFVVSAVVALGLIGVAGFYNFSGWRHNAEEREKLNAAYEELMRLNTLNPHPGDNRGKVDNIKLAREQEKELQAFIAKVALHFTPIAAIPEGTNVSGKEFSSALQQTIDQLQREATNNSVILPPKYKYSFEAHLGRVQFAAGSLQPLAVQLGEVKTIASILNLAKINALDGIRRERVSVDDNSGPPADYLELKSTTNELAVLTPYEVTFRCFTPELASVLSGLAASPHGLLVKSINVEPAAVTVMSENVDAPAAPVYYAAPPVAPSQMNQDLAFSRRYGIGGKDRPTRPAGPVATAPPMAVAAPAARPAVQTLVKERQLKVVMLLQVVKLLPEK